VDDAIANMIAVNRHGKRTRGRAAQTDLTAYSRAGIRRRPRLGGVVNYYERAA